MNPASFKAKFISDKEIWAAADGLRGQFPKSCAKLPIDVMALAEFDLGLEFLPLPLSGIDGDALLLGDLKTLVVDKDTFKSPNHNRVRFSIAHEIGHLKLHSQIYGRLKFESVEKWITFIDKIPNTEYQRIEFQAYEFAGRLLVPLADLRHALTEGMQIAQDEGYAQGEEHELLDFVSKTIAPDFGVSTSVISKRLQREKLWPITTGSQN